MPHYYAVTLHTLKLTFYILSFTIYLSHLQFWFLICLVIFKNWIKRDQRDVTCFIISLMLNMFRMLIQ